MAGRTFAALSDRQLAELLGLIKSSDSVELKLTVSESDHYSTVQALGMDTLDAQLRHVFFFDTPDLALNESGLVVRARRVQGKGDDSVMKLRPVTPDDLPADLRRSPSFNVEVDAAPDGFVCSGSLKATLGPSVVKETLQSGAPDPQALHEGAARVLPGARSGRHRPGRPGGPRARSWC